MPMLPQEMRSKGLRPHLSTTLPPRAQQTSMLPLPTQMATQQKGMARSGIIPAPRCTMSCITAMFARLKVKDSNMSCQRTRLLYTGATSVPRASTSVFGSCPALPSAFPPAARTWSMVSGRMSCVAAISTKAKLSGTALQAALFAVEPSSSVSSGPKNEKRPMEMAPTTKPVWRPTLFRETCCEKFSGSIVPNVSAPMDTIIIAKPYARGTWFKNCSTKYCGKKTVTATLSIMLMPPEAAKRRLQWDRSQSLPRRGMKTVMRPCCSAFIAPSSSGE
mmetsp:Transcript_74570/g.205621  ORF Transcript_74570/g.205621 Transcript_74570/m.205621 type:complete len:276 (+) Transcript_74570:564-1391(+)